VGIGHLVNGIQQMIRIVESHFITSAVQADQYPPTITQDFAFVGRSNVGKSSMINALAGRKLLAKTANTPGKTRLINFFECRFTQTDTETHIPTETNFCLVDLPGYGFAKVSKKERDSWHRMITEYFTQRNQLAGVIVLVDSRHAPDPKDVNMVDLLKKSNINFFIAATKVDKIAKGKIPSTLKRFTQAFQLPNTQIAAFSAHTNIGQNDILNYIETIIKNLVLHRREIIHS